MASASAALICGHDRVLRPEITITGSRDGPVQSFGSISSPVAVRHVTTSEMKTTSPLPFAHPNPAPHQGSSGWMFACHLQPAPGQCLCQNGANCAVVVKQAELCQSICYLSCSELYFQFGLVGPPASEMRNTVLPGKNLP